MRRVAIFVFVSVFVFSVYASTQVWTDVGDGLYVDTKSQKRQGDIAAITARDSRGATGRMEFDCVKRLWLDQKDGVKDVNQWEDDSSLKRIFSAACKRWYEVWK